MDRSAAGAGSFELVVGDAEVVALGVRRGA